jgi:prepilin peptidase CpaA
MDTVLIGEAGRWLFISAMVALAVHDVTTFRIPNWANAAVAAGAVLFAAVMALLGADVQWLEHLGAATLVFVAGFAMFQFRALGGGDVKLLAAAALWVGWDGLLFFVVAVGLAGGGLVLMLLMLRNNLMALVAWASPRVPSSWPRVLTAGEKVPYGVAIAIGAVLVALQRQYGLFAV